MRALVLCLDISESMAYGEPSKLKQAFNVIHKALQGLSQDLPKGLVTFDVTAEVLLDPQPANQKRIRDELDHMTPRGVSCIAGGLVEAANLVEKSGGKGEVLLLTDGRANLSQNRIGGFEGSLDLEKELLEIAKETSQRDVTLHTVAVGEDAFTYTLSTMSENAKGRYWLAEDFQGFAAGPPRSPRILKACELKVHGAPAELPSAQPTWTKESQFTHVAVVSQSLFEAYQTHRRAFLVNPNNVREARTALVSVESDVLAGYRQRRPKTVEIVRTEEAILLDKSYRNYLALGEDAVVRLAVY